MKKKITPRQRRHIRIRKKIIGTAEKPRLNVRRSLKNLFVQIVDDANHKTLMSVSTVDKDMKAKNSYGGNVKSAVMLGEVVAQKAKENHITSVVFDRGGYDFHGRIKAFAQAAREGGLEF